jgi:hypothetical protein
LVFFPLNSTTAVAAAACGPTAVMMFKSSVSLYSYAVQIHMWCSAPKVASRAGQPAMPLCCPTKNAREMLLSWPRRFWRTEVVTLPCPPDIPHNRTLTLSVKKLLSPDGKPLLAAPLTWIFHNPPAWCSCSEFLIMGFLAFD